MKPHPVPLDERVLGPNPFPKEDARHARWRDACRSAAEEEADVLTTALRRLEACPESQLSIELVNGIAGAFDVRARYMVALMVLSYDDIAPFEQALPRLTEAVAALACELCPSFLQKDAFVGQVRIRLASRVAHWQQQALKLARESTKAVDAALAHAADRAEILCGSWPELTIQFTSDHRVQVTVPGGSYIENYAEMGFEDRKTKNPNVAWTMLRTIAEGSGRISTPPRGIPWSKVEKRVQEIRRTLRTYFEQRKIVVPTGDPLPFVTDQGYVAAFRLGVGLSYKK